MKSVFPRPIFLGASVRSPIGKFGGALQRFSAPELASMTLQEGIRRTGELKIDTVIMGHARQAGCGPNPARQASIGAGLSEKIPAFTVNQACASGMTALFSAIEKIALGRAQNIWAGGVESMSNTPYLLPQARWGQRLGNAKVLDGMWKDGFFCPMADMVMGETVERFLAQEMKISRKEQDLYALQSQQKASQAWEKDLFQNEIFSIPDDPTNARREGLDHDEHLRPDTELKTLEKLTPVFDAQKGTITAGNSSGITDGAAFLLVSAEKTKNTQAEVIDFETIALDPERMGLGPIAATQNLLKRQNLQVKDLQAVEINEAFAAQVIACQRTLKVPEDRLNPKGGSIALGHPIGASGARITTTLLHHLHGQTDALGLATLCVSGGQGVALLIRMT